MKNAKAYTAAEWKENEQKDFEAWALKQGVDAKKRNELGAFSFEDSMKLARRAAGERHWILEHGCDDDLDKQLKDEYQAELAEDEIQTYAWLNPVVKVERLLKRNDMSLYEFYLFLADLNEYGFFTFEKIELEGCEDEVDAALATSGENDGNDRNDDNDGIDDVNGEPCLVHYAE